MQLCPCSSPWCGLLCCRFSINAAAVADFRFFSKLQVPLGTSETCPIILFFWIYSPKVPPSSVLGCFSLFFFKVSFEKHPNGHVPGIIKRSISTAAHQRREKSYWDVAKWRPLRCEYYVSTMSFGAQLCHRITTMIQGEELPQYLMWGIWELIGKINKRNPKCTMEERGAQFCDFSSQNPHKQESTRFLLYKE